MNASKVPVLIPVQMVGDLRIFTSAYHYTATGSQPGAQFELHGSRQAFTGPPRKADAATPPPPLPPINGLSNLRVEKSEIGVDVSFSRFGALYQLTISCDDPDKDPRCSPPIAASIALGLVYLGGGQ